MFARPLCRVLEKGEKKLTKFVLILPILTKTHTFGKANGILCLRMSAVSYHLSVTPRRKFCSYKLSVIESHKRSCYHELGTSISTHVEDLLGLSPVFGIHDSTKMWGKLFIGNWEPHMYVHSNHPSYVI